MPELGERAGHPWLTVRDRDEHAVLITVVGGTVADRANDLWAACESAMETADSRPVITDLTAATGFDIGTIQALRLAARSALRWRLAFCAVMRANSALEQYSRSVGLDQMLPIFRSLGDAVNAGGLGPMAGGDAALP